MNILKDRFKDKVIIITGASRGIGRAVSLRAAKEGAKVALIDLRDDEGVNLQNQILNDGGIALFIKADLSKEDEVKSAIQIVIEKFGKIDSLINIAGVTGKPVHLHLMTKEDFDSAFKINFYSVYFCCKYVLREFIKENHGGTIVNTGSIGGIVGLKGNAAYTASKHAINGLTKNLAIDYAKYNIRVNSVNPCPTKTPMVEQSMAFMKKKMEEAIKNGILKPGEANKLWGGGKSENLLGRMTEADEQAASILYLASSDSSHMTGTIMQTDGGWTAF